MNTVKSLPAALSFLLLGAHFMRSGACVLLDPVRPASRAPASPPRDEAARIAGSSYISLAIEPVSSSNSNSVSSGLRPKQ